VDIIINRDNFLTLANIVIANPTCTNLMEHVSTTTMHATIIGIQNKA
jgi:hypothetical protein